MNDLTSTAYQDRRWLVSLVVTVNAIVLSLLIGSLPVTAVGEPIAPSTNPTAIASPSPSPTDAPSPSVEPTTSPTDTPTTEPTPSPTGEPTTPEPSPSQTTQSPSQPTTPTQTSDPIRTDGPTGTWWSLVNLNVRETPGGEVIVTVPVNTALTLTGRVTGEWSETTRGWVKTVYLTSVKPAEPTTKPTQAPTTKPTTKPTPPPPPPVTSDAPPSEGTTERVIFDCINRERTSRGIPALKYDNQLAGVAQRWTQHMSDTDTMSHNPSVGSQLDSWRRLGENVGYTTYPNPGESLCQAWMNSSGHRANILNPEFGRTGIGVVVNGRTRWSTQNFRD